MSNPVAPLGGDRAGFSRLFRPDPRTRAGRGTAVGMDGALVGRSPQVLARRFWILPESVVAA